MEVTLFYPNIKQLFITIFYCSVIITGCSDILHSTNNHKHYGHHNNHNFNAIEEYISRIGKRLLIVSNDVKLANVHIIFDFNTSNTPSLTINYDQKFNHTSHNIITISKGLLDSLQDEAELATVLAISLESLYSNDFASSNDSVAHSADNRILNHLYKAGYDPMAFVELQNEYLTEKDPEHSWLKPLFLPINLNKQRVAINKKTVLTMPSGLQRGKQRYLSSMNLLKK